LAVAALLFVVSGCSSSEPEKEAGPENSATPEKSATPSGPFTIDFDVSAAGDHVVLHGTTNLPDGALVTVVLGRMVKFKGEDPRNFPVGGDGVEVANGEFTADLEVDEKMMIDTLILPADQTSFGPIEKVSDLVNACVQVRTNDGKDRPQPDSVMKAIGTGGANFETSPQKTKFGDALWLETFKTVKLVSPALGYISERLGTSVAHGSNVAENFCLA
jgi:hypothetical protein